MFNLKLATSNLKELVVSGVEKFTDDLKENMLLTVSVFSLLCAILFAVATLFSHVTVNLTNSVPGTFFLQQPNEPLAKGKFVMIPAAGEFFGPKVKNFTKYARCMPGDAFEQKGSEYFCNGDLIATAKPFAQDGRKLSPFITDQTSIPKGYFFAGSDHPDGYDSRYFGFVKVSEAVVLEKLL